MPLVFPFVEYLNSLITADRGEREQQYLSSISLVRCCLDRFANGFPIEHLFRQSSGCWLLSHSRHFQLVKPPSIFDEQRKMGSALRYDGSAGSPIYGEL